MVFNIEQGWSIVFPQARPHQFVSIYCPISKDHAFMTYNGKETCVHTSTFFAHLNCVDHAIVSKAAHRNLNNNQKQYSQYSRFNCGGVLEVYAHLMLCLIRVHLMMPLN